MCGNQIQTTESQDTLLVNEGDQVLEDINCTRNHLNGDGAGIEPRYPKSLHLFACSVEYCVGTNGIIVIPVADADLKSFHDNIEMVNIYNNTVSHSPLIGFVGKLTFTNCFFAANSHTTVSRANNWGPNGVDYQPSAWELYTTLINCTSDVEITGDNLYLVDCVVGNFSKPNTLIHEVSCETPSYYFTPNPIIEHLRYKLVLVHCYVLYYFDEL